MSEVFDPSAGQPLPITTANSQDVAVEVVNDLRRGGKYETVAQDVEARITMGERKYGSRLKSFNGRNALRDLYDELLDSLNYAKQLELEGQGFASLYRDLFGLTVEIAHKLGKV